MVGVVKLVAMDLSMRLMQKLCTVVKTLRWVLYSFWNQTLQRLSELHFRGTSHSKVTTFEGLDVIHRRLVRRDGRFILTTWLLTPDTRAQAGGSRPKSFGESFPRRMGNGSMGASKAHPAIEFCAGRLLNSRLFFSIIISYFFCWAHVKGGKKTGS